MLFKKLIQIPNHVGSRLDAFPHKWGKRRGRDKSGPYGPHSCRPPFGPDLSRPPFGPDLSRPPFGPDLSRPRFGPDLSRPRFMAFDKLSAFLLQSAQATSNFNGR
jgi:hypothetical protein